MRYKPLKFFKDQAYDRIGKYSVKIEILLFLRIILVVLLISIFYNTLPWYLFVSFSCDIVCSIQGFFASYRRSIFLLFIFFLASLLLFLFNFIPLVLMNSLIWNNEFYDVSFNDILQSVIHVLWFACEIITMHYARKQRALLRDEKALADSIDPELHLKRTSLSISVAPPIPSSSIYASNIPNYSFGGSSYFSTPATCPSATSSYNSEYFDYEGFYVPPLPHHPYHLTCTTSSSLSASSILTTGTTATTGTLTSSTNSLGQQQQQLQNDINNLEACELPIPPPTASDIIRLSPSLNNVEEVLVQ